jgi:hypothetical protein
MEHKLSKEARRELLEALRNRFPLLAGGRLDQAVYYRLVFLSRAY